MKLRIANCKHGMTLIELLVVIIILTTIVAAAIPLVSPSNDDRRMREAARGLNTFITGAQTRAIALNRPYGVALKRLSQDTGRAEDNGVCLEVFYVEQQQPYAGFDANSRCCVSLKSIGLAVIRFVTRGTPTGAGLPAGWVADIFPGEMIGPGDIIEVGGTRYELLEGDQTVTLNTFGQRKPSAQSGKYYIPPSSPGAKVTALARPINDTGQQINLRYDDSGYSIGPDREPSPPAPVKPPAPYWTSPAPYKVFRQPTPATDEPYQLPEGTAIDLRASGVGSDFFFLNPSPSDPNKLVDNSHGILLTFAPEGRVERVALTLGTNTSGTAFSTSAVENVYVNLGRRENIPAPNIGADPTLQTSSLSGLTDEQLAKLRQPLNWLRGSSQWVVIGSQSGRIATIENAFVNLGTIAAMGSPSEQLRNQQILSAREFTREMSQVGGR